MKNHEGLAASPGIAIGQAWIFRPQIPNIDTRTISDAEVKNEYRAFRNAQAKVDAHLEALYNRVLEKQGEHEAAIFESHRELLADEELDNDIQALIRDEHKTATAAVKEYLDQVAANMRALEDEYLRERAAEFEDLQNNLLLALNGLPFASLASAPPDSVIFAEDLTPSETAQLDIEKVRGFVLEHGGLTSHVAILARNLGMPAVMGMRNIMNEVKSGITALLDGDTGELILNPDDKTRKIYSEKKAQELAVEAEHNRLFDKFHAQEEAWIRKGIEARRTRNEGRVRRLEELRRQRAERRNVQGQVNFKLDSGEKSGKIIAELEHASFAYGDKVIMDKFSAILQRGDKIGLIGPNGIGKTTFLKLILGELQPTYGKIRIGSKQEVAYFDQFRSALNENDTVFYTLGQGNDYVEVGGKKKHVMSYLEDFLFHPARAQSPVSSLSGGERNRLLLAKLFTRPANILVLDEPTNDLDIDTQELLEDLLRDYQGTVFLVSHDRMFLDNVITQSIVFEGQGRLKEYIGGYQDYIDAKSREDKIQTASAPKAVAEPEKIKPKANRTVKLSYKEQRELDALPDEIAALETEQAEINAQLSDPEIFKDYEKAGALQSRAEEIEMSLLEKLERWEWLEAKQNGEAV